MLLRVYRLTDKFGLVVLKLSALVAEAVLDGAQTVLDATRWGGGGVLALALRLLTLVINGVLALLTGVLVVLRATLNALWWLTRKVVKAVSDMLRLLFRGVLTLMLFGARLMGWGVRGADSATHSATRRVARSASTQVSGEMARRATTSEMDVGLAEDPLRVQNRWLSVLVAALGLLVIGVVLFATDPNRMSAPRAGAVVPGDNISLLTPNAPASDATLVPAGIAAQPTPFPTATQIPDVLQVSGAIAYTLRERGQNDLWAVSVGTRDAVRLTNDPAEDRQPVWSPDGRQIAYASRRDGNWELYVLDVNALAGNPAAVPARVTFDLSFQGAPSWSPDGLWLAYESYQGENLDIYAVPVDGSDTPRRLTDHPTADFSPAWSPQGRQIAFISWRDGSQDIFLFDLDTLDASNLTNTPGLNEDHPAWSPDGRYLAYSALEQGREKVFVIDTRAPDQAPQVISFGRQPSWSPDGAGLTFAVDAADGSASYFYAEPFSQQGVATEVIAVAHGATSPSWGQIALPPALVSVDGVPPHTDEPLFDEQVIEYDEDPPYKMGALPDVQAPNPVLNDRVNDSFTALRRDLLTRVGWDFLGELDDAFWEITRRPQPGEARRNWHLTGRAFAIRRTSIQGFPPQIEVVREDIGVNTYWRIFVRVDEDAQSGQLGEPLRRMPWDLLSRNAGGDVEAYNQGGRLRQSIPEGYYVDFTQLAADYGWQRWPAGPDWRANVNSMNYWLYVKPQGLDWYAAMREIYAEPQLGGWVPTPTPAPVDTADNTEAS